MVNTPWKRTSSGYGDESDDHQHTSKRAHRAVVPFIENPCVGADYADAVFSQRHEANPDELCFDLFFVANLATFTAYHTVDSSGSLAAYVGFFAILWATWFQITLHDVRFARDSVYERCCKVVQFVVFVGLALVGSKFEPNENVREGGSGNKNYQVLCVVLVASRCLLALQYAVVMVAVARKRFSKLYLPLGLNIAVYLVAAAVFGAMILAFRPGAAGRPGLYWIWWVVLFLEGVGTITISCFWRILSFKKTHLVERMGLLTLIVIGEGAIGVTKTVGKMMGKSDIDVQGIFLVVCIVLVLVFLFLNYFDNAPRGHYGTIRQQIWALLHFPFQLAVVGVGEGSQHLALARHITNYMKKFESKIIKACVKEGLEGDKLVKKLEEAVKYYQLDKKPECYRQVLQIKDSIAKLGNMTGICAKSYTKTFPSSTWDYAFPSDFSDLVTEVGSGVTMSTGMKIPVGEEPFGVLQHSWQIVYIYYWAALLAIFACIIAFLILTRNRQSRIDLFDATSIGGRVLMASLCLLFGCLGIAGAGHHENQDKHNTTAIDREAIYLDFLASGWVVPTGTIMLGVTLVADHCARHFCNWRLRRHGYAVAPPDGDDDDHGHLLHQAGIESGVGGGGGHGHHSRVHSGVSSLHHRTNSAGSNGAGKLILAGEVEDVDEVLAKRRAHVRQSRALGFREQSPPRPANALYLLGNFAANLTNVGDAPERGGGRSGSGDTNASNTTLVGGASPEERGSGRTYFEGEADRRGSFRPGLYSEKQG